MESTGKKSSKGCPRPEYSRCQTRAPLRERHMLLKCIEFCFMVELAGLWLAGVIIRLASP